MRWRHFRMSIIIERALTRSFIRVQVGFNIIALSLTFPSQYDATTAKRVISFISQLSVSIFPMNYNFCWELTSYLIMSGKAVEFKWYELESVKIRNELSNKVSIVNHYFKTYWNCYKDFQVLFRVSNVPYHLIKALLSQSNLTQSLSHYSR